MRVEKTIKNSIVAIITNIVSVLIGIIAQAVFLNIMGTEYLGINSLFSNIVSMLGIVELGIGSAIVYHLYKPIAENDIVRIRTLMKFYKKCYSIIAIVILIIGMILLPFIDIFVGEINVDINIYIIFILFIIDSVASYLLTYKRSILYADQRTYIVNLVHIIYLLIMNSMQILILILTRNYVLYLIIKILCRILENIILNIIVNKKYPYLKEKSKENLDKITLLDIKTKIKGLFFHKISSYVVNGTDNIVISVFLGVSSVGIYSNYYMIINALNILINQIFSSIVATVGNLLTEKNQKKNFYVYKNMLFANFWIATFCTISFYCIVQDFIVLWVGEEYLLNKFIIFTIAMVFYLQTMRRTLNSFKEANGIFFEDRYSAVAEAIINLVTSIIFVKVLGMAGVFVGTIISSLYIFIYAYPKYTYSPLFNKTRLEYLKENSKYLIIFLFIGFVTYICTNIIEINMLMIRILYDIIVCLVIPNILMIVIFRKKEEFEYLKNILISIINKFRFKGEKK